MADRRFFNQDGDPYLFEIYRRWGASIFAPTATLCNTIGGAGTARYEKHSARDWRDQLLTDSIAQLSRYLDTLAPSHNLSRVHCLDVVVPTFRCDLVLLKAITNLRVTGGRASTTIVIVVDNPLSNQVAAVQVRLYI